MDKVKTTKVMDTNPFKATALSLGGGESSDSKPTDELTITRILDEIFGLSDEESEIAFQPKNESQKYKDISTHNSSRFAEDSVNS